ncbi:uncharacterized protein LOC112493783 [Cephus cinctus]|uniref:Uncharacterized protein LOC112493783 n=1 Tax=Cephus cinctus TaxID=211228 RepID=A0AAJ7R984_CEPCN|nr:uncharacterized protein LOC112493783 [Cephus cinctus]
MSALCYNYMVVVILSKLISLFMLCYYNGKVFQEGQNTKHILQKIRALSLEHQFVMSTNAFIRQIKENKQYKICGLSSLDMSFPIKILEYVVNYILVFVQFLGFQE